MTYKIANIIQGESILVFGFKLIVCIVIPNILFLIFFIKRKNLNIYMRRCYGLLKEIDRNYSEN